MATTQSAEFITGTSPATWTCPTGVTAVWLTAVGGGSGVNGNWGGGGGAGELVTNLLVPVVPTTVYTVTIGAKGLGALTESQPTLPTASVFNGFSALGAQNINVVPGFGGNACGKGGGAGFGLNTDALTRGYGIAESRHYFGGGSGRGGNAGGAAYGPGVHGGPTPTPGGAGNSGGAGAGSLWGGTNGAAENVGNVDANPSHYGAGTTGNGAAAGGPGGDGAPGYVLLMWIA